MSSIFLKLFFVKESCEQSIQQLEKHLSVIWAATTEKFDFFKF